ncbi:MAG TPA: metallophosphoesterase [Flavisolibacter sp.]|nr:metallophosphoesterase [Flavisolibacter sp.]
MKPMNFLKALLFLTGLTSGAALMAQTTIIPSGSSWKYWANTQANAPAGWQGSSFDDSGWPSGNAQLGYGDGDEATIIPYGPDPNNKYITTYFRKTVTITDPTQFGTFSFNVTRDDGYVLYVNGVEMNRNNMPAGAVSYTTLASSAIEDAVISFNIPSSNFVAGNNVIAVEMHQANATSSDISFNLSLAGTDLFSAGLLRGPYLQMGNQTEITIRWRTTNAENSRIELGTSYGTYPIVVSDATVLKEHIVRVTGLTADTKYYYRIGNSTNMGSADAGKFFTTAPLATTTRKIRIAAFGDCGRNNTTYQDQNLTNYQSYLSTNGIDAPDAWILLGDNAYSTGSDAEYTSNFFGIYGDNILKNHKLYPTPGNHDYANNTANKPSRAMPYYSNFSTPQNAECGGVASNKPNFYSFDIGNIHFLALDAWGIESDGTEMGTSGSTMLKTWLDADLAANTKKWTIAYWHHPPYTKSSHNSDSETELVNIRTNFISFLESRGVDLVINGHAHAYERGYLLRNFTGSWTSFTPALHAVSTSSATYTSNTTCPYVYNSTPANHGTVYVVAGSTGASGSVNTGFGANAFPFSVNDAGIFYFEVEDNRLDAKMLRRNGTVFDQFTIMKDVNTSNSITINQGQSTSLSASWPGTGTYTWNTAQTGRSISVTPPVGTTAYTVTDDFGCVTDQFSVNVLAVLPVTLSKYEVRQEKKQVRIEWTTASETNAKSFTVERSADGSIFQSLEILAAKGSTTATTSYSVTDKHPLKGLGYYRLAQTDADNHTRYFDVRKVNYTEGSGFEVKLHAGSQGVALYINSAQAGKLSLEIYDLSGRLVQSADWTLTSGMNEKAVNLGKGSYVFNFINESGERVVQKVIVP